MLAALRILNKYVIFAVLCIINISAKVCTNVNGIITHGRAF